jgi:Probable cobalt transporter subunit (CbtA)
VVRALLVRGLLVGLLAGVVGFAFARVAGEPQVSAAIAFEDGQADHPAAGGDDHSDHVDDPVVSRRVQSTFGLALGVVVTGVAFGGLFALVYAFSLGRVGPPDPRPLALAIALGALVAGYVVPFLKYPANPPAVGAPETAGRRTVLYLVMVALSLVAAAGAIVVRRRLLLHHDRWNATTLAAAFYVGVILVAYLVLPGVDEVPAGFPADVLWGFRMASLGLQSVLWVTIGLAFGALAERRRAVAGSVSAAPSFTR